MGGELVSDPPTKREFPVSPLEFFFKCLPTYLVYGMTANEFWNGDVELAGAYRKAYRLKLELQDTMLWRQGLYIYDALCAVSPAMNAFSKKPKPHPYVKQPFGFKWEEEPKSPNTAAKAYMARWAAKVNAQFKAREVVSNGRSHD